MPFDTATRRKLITMPPILKPVGGGPVSVQLPRAGYLSKIFLNFTGSVSGTLSSPNPLGFASVVRRVRVQLNNGIDQFNVSAAGYIYDMLANGAFENSFPSTQLIGSAKNAVSATNFSFTIVDPVMVNSRDPIGLILLQSDQITVTLTIEWEADANVATGATVTAQCEPLLEFFTVPPTAQDQPDTTILHQILEDQVIIPGSGTFTYNWPRGNLYLQLFHGFGIGVSPADNFSRYQLRVNYSEYYMDVDPAMLNAYVAWQTLANRQTGTIPVDLISSSGNGNYDKIRDSINSADVTDLASIIYATTTGTLYTQRRLLMKLV